ncbi:MAG: OmpH family outer membrane protein, partial [Bacteroidia bacterium]
SFASIFLPLPYQYMCLYANKKGELVQFFYRNFCKTRLKTKAYFYTLLIMNLSFNKLIIAVTVILTFTGLNAQKVAHLHLDSLINSMTETKTAQEVIDKFRKEIETESINMQTDFENKVKDYQDKETSYSAAAKQKKINELQTLQKRVEEFKNEAYQKIQVKYNEFTTPIVNKARKGISDFARENNYNYVLDTSAGNVLYFETSDDIFALVLKKLEAMPAAELPVQKASAKTENKPASKPPANKGTPAKGK